MPHHHPNDDLEHLRGLRAVATLELTKGIAVSLGIVWLLSLIHKDPGDVMANILDKLHVAPGRHVAQWLLEKADSVTPETIFHVAIFASVYVLIRFAEAYGLWNGRIWAEWFALISGALYLPFEIYELIHKASPIKWGVLVINVIIVLYMAHLRMQARNARNFQPQSQT